jgi:hypothetical protein
MRSRSEPPGGQVSETSAADGTRILSGFAEPRASCAPEASGFGRTCYVDPPEKLDCYRNRSGCSAGETSSLHTLVPGLGPQPLGLVPRTSILTAAR